MTGKTISHYRILEKLGSGGMGVVYKAEDTHLDRFVAIKVLPPEKVADEERKRRFVQEAKSASALNHPNIIHIYDIAEADGIQFIAMEYVPGKTLDHVIGRKGLRLADSLKYAVQIADALAKAHTAGIIHRDLKPSNIMVTDDDLVKVLDFGLAKLNEPLSGDFGETATIKEGREKPDTAEGTIIGTVAYMSPEQAQAKKVDARSDIFSFGSVLYEMLTGRRAFQGEAKIATLSAILKEEPKPISAAAPDAPRDLEKIISRCLRKDPERRFQHMADVKVALGELKEESESGTLTAPASAWGSRRPWMWVAAALAFLSIAVGTWLFRGAKRKPPDALEVVPLTSYAGFENSLSFSPDGNQVVFSWNGDKQDNFDIYVKLIDSPTQLRLTTDPAPDVSPVLSPDGRSIGFVRASKERSLIVIEPGQRFDSESDKIFVLSRGGTDDDKDPFLINGSASPAPMELRAGWIYRFRFIGITPAPHLQVTLYREGRRQTWRMIAKDGAALPPSQAVRRPADVDIYPGEIYDFEFRPVSAGPLRLAAEQPFFKQHAVVPIIVRMP